MLWLVPGTETLTTTMTTIDRITAAREGRTAHKHGIDCTSFFISSYGKILQEQNLYFLLWPSRCTCFVISSIVKLLRCGSSSQGSFLGNPVDELAVSHPESAKRIEEPMMGNMSLLGMMLSLSRDRIPECTPTSRDRSVGYSTLSLRGEFGVPYRV